MCACKCTWTQSRPLIAHEQQACTVTLEASETRQSAGCSFQPRMTAGDVAVPLHTSACMKSISKCAQPHNQYHTYLGKRKHSRESSLHNLHTCTAPQSLQAHILRYSLHSHQRKDPAVSLNPTSSQMHILRRDADSALYLLVVGVPLQGSFPEGALYGALTHVRRIPAGVQPQQRIVSQHISLPTATCGTASNSG